MEFDLLMLLALTAFVAGFVDAIAGGGGLITLPVLMLTGVAPVQAIATNKLQASAASVSAMFAFTRRGLVDWQREGWRVFLSAFIGGAIGALLVKYVNQQYLATVVPLLLIVVALYFAFGPNLSSEKQKQRISVALYAALIAPILGLYDGFFGPGTGSFFLITLIALAGQPLMRAMGLTKVGNAASNVGSLLVFMLSGLVLWKVALVMAVGSFLGAHLGVRVAVSVGARVIKPMIIIVCLSLATKLLLS